MTWHEDPPAGLARTQPGIFTPFGGLIGVFQIIDKGCRIALPSIADGLDWLATLAERLEHLPALVDYARWQETQGSRIGEAGNRGGSRLADGLGQKGRTPSCIQHQNFQTGLTQKASRHSARGARTDDNGVKTCRTFNHLPRGAGRDFGQDLVGAQHGFQISLGTTFARFSAMCSDHASIDSGLGGICVTENSAQIRDRIGFGTGRLLPDLGRDTAVRLIHAALDAGLTHIDTARLYGHGWAEGVIGEAIKDRRNQVFLVSKAGILPAENGLQRRAVNKALTIGRRLPGAAGILPEPRWNEPRFGAFSVQDIRASLHTSFEQLGTDYLDLFLLHEVELQHLQSGEVIELLEDLKREGSIRNYGIASTPDQTRDILKSGVGFDYVQTAASIFDRNIKEFSPGDHTLITHSWLGAAMARFMAAFERDHGLADKAARAMYADIRKPDQLAQCLLQNALGANPDGKVLFSTNNPSRIVDMVRTAESRELSEEQRVVLACVARTVRKMTSDMA